MSVTSILSYYNKDYKDFRALLNKEIRTPKLNQKQIPPLLAPSISRNYALVGTAFDYYLRFSIEKNFRKVISSRWVAEASIELLGNSVKSNSDLKKFKDLWASYKEKLTESAFKKYTEYDGQEARILSVKEGRPSIRFIKTKEQLDGLNPVHLEKA